MFVLFCLAVLLAATLFAGGRLSALGALRLRAWPLLAAALGLQLVITELTTHGLPGWVDATLHVVSYLLAAVAIWRNRRVPGLLLLAAGAAGNGVTIALNGGRLPASAAALRAAHVHESATGFANSGAVAHPVLPWLGDVWASPSWLPFQNVVSVGDVLVLAGAAWLLVGVCGTRWTRRSEPSDDVTSAVTSSPVAA